MSNEFDIDKAAYEARLAQSKIVSVMWNMHIEALGKLYASAMIDMAPDFECTAKDRFVGCHQTSTPWEMIQERVMFAAMTEIRKHDWSDNKEFDAILRKLSAEVESSLAERIMGIRHLKNEGVVDAS